LLFAKRLSGLLQQELRRTDNLAANALLLIRATGIRIGECLDLSLDCLRQLGPGRWALHVPLGKLHTERFRAAPAGDGWPRDLGSGFPVSAGPPWSTASS